MNEKLHFWLSFGMVVAAVGAAILLLTSGLDWAPGALCAAAYALGVFSHRTLLETAGAKPAWQHWAVASIWPLVGVWLLAWLLLPEPRDADLPPPPKEAQR